jgi:hypothetical protein
MDRVTLSLRAESGFFCVIFHLCTAYLEYGNKLLVDTSKWCYGQWNQYFQSIPEGSSVEMLTIPTLPLNVHKWTIGDYRRAIREVVRPNAILRYEIKQVIKRIGQPYTAIFVRRGDKIASGEAKFIPVSDILRHVKYDENTTFFVQTDDYAVVEEMRECLPHHRIHSTVPPTKRGSYHSAKYKQNVAVPWTEKDPASARAETMEMLAGLFVCLEAQECWTDDTSNVGRFLKLYKDSVHVYPEDYSVNERLHAHPAWSLRA